MISLSRRRFIRTAAIAGMLSPAIISSARAVTSRTILQGATKLYCGTGTSFGSISGLGPDFPSISAALSALKSSFDTGSQSVELRLLDGTVDPGFTLYGKLLGQGATTELCVRASSIGAAKIQPSGGAAAIGLAYGAAVAIADLVMDGAVQAGAGHAQDVIQLGQGGQLSMFGWNRIIQNSYSYNGITINQAGSSVDQLPQSWGSPIPNGGNLSWQGQYQAGIQTDNFGTLNVDANGQHGLIAWWMESSSYRSRPYWAVDFLDVGPGEVHVDGVDFHGAADGYAYRVRPEGILYVNMVQDPNQINAIPGSARTGWPVLGAII